MEKITKECIWLIGCGKEKVGHAARPHDLYNSHYFRTKLNYACRMSRDSEGASLVYVLSGEYGLMDNDTLYEPYETSLNHFSDKRLREWSAMVNRQLRQRFDIDHCIFDVIAGVKYHRYIDLPEMRVAFARFGIGDQLRLMSPGRIRLPQGN